MTYVPQVPSGSGNTLFPSSRPLVEGTLGTNLGRHDPHGNLETVLRPYQRAAVDAVLRDFAVGRRRVLVVMATGLGKTVLFADLVRQELAAGGRVLVLAHRGELLEQAAQKLAVVGVVAALEQGGQRAAADAGCVVASVQTMRGRRLEQWAPDAFTLIVVDEAHHATAPGYTAVVARFATARVLGVTATPDRLDGAALRDVFEVCSYRYEMRAAIQAGYLAPLVARRVHVEGLDLAGVRTKAGDLDRSELGAVMAAEEHLHGVAVPTLELAGDRRTIVFAVDVAHANALAEVLNRYHPNVARAVDGTARAADRAALLADFRAGAFRVLVNCALFTEGFDEPTISCVVVARPTKSRALYTQMVGRGTRLAPGKSDCLVLDVTGMAGRHRLIGPADVLAGGLVSDDVRAELERSEREPGDLETWLALAEQRAAERRRQAAITAIARYWAEEIDPFLGDVAPGPEWSDEPATERQRTAIERAGFRRPPDQLTKAEAARLLDAVAARREAGLCTARQTRLLRRYAIEARSLTLESAGVLIARIEAHGWRATPALQRELREQVAATGGRRDA